MAKIIQVGKKDSRYEVVIGKNTITRWLRLFKLGKKIQGMRL